MNYFEMLKYSKTGISNDEMTGFDKAKATALCGGGAKTISGEPPLSFDSAASGYLIDWQIDGQTVSGAKVGDQTANLFTGEYIGGSVNNDTFIFVTATSGAKSAIIAVEPNTTYTIQRIDSSNRFNLGECADYPVNNTQLTKIYSGNNPPDYITFTTASTTHYIVAYVSTSSEKAEPRMMLNTGSTALDYEPYGYKIPVTCGGSTTNIYIDSQIGDGESVTKAGTGVEIPVAEGNNTFSVGTTIQPASVTIKY